MAFYRCDRGLGFDTSNSTGTSSDVLKYLRNGRAIFNNGKYNEGSIESADYTFHTIDVSNFETILKFQILNNNTTSITNYQSLILTPNKYMSNEIRIPTTDFDSNNYKNVIYGKPGNSNLKFINRKYKEILRIAPLYGTGQLYFEKSGLFFERDFYGRNLNGYEKKYSSNNINYSYSISFDNELIKNLYNIAKSENNDIACNELSKINTTDIGNIIKYSGLTDILQNFFIYKTQNNDVYIYSYYNNDADNITSTKLNLKFNSNYSDEYPGLYNTFSNKDMYIHEPYIKITNDGKIAHFPIINTTPNPNIIFSQARTTSFQSLVAISDENIYNIYSSLTGLYFRKYSLDYEIISEIKINTDQFYFIKDNSDCLKINVIMYCYENNIVIDNDEWYGRNIVSLDYNGNLISVLAFHYNRYDGNTRCIRVQPRKDYIGIFTSDYKSPGDSTDARISYSNHLLNNYLLTIYYACHDLNFLNYIELNSYNLDIMNRTEYDRYCIPYNTKFGVRSYLGIDRDKNNKIIYDKYPLCSYNKIPLIYSVYNYSSPYLVNIKDDRSMIINYDHKNYIISIYDNIYLLNDYDTNYNGYSIDNTNSNYTDYYFN